VPAAVGSAGPEGAEAEGKGLGAEDAERRTPGGLAVELEVGHGRGEDRQRLLHLGPGQAGAQAVVGSSAEGEVGLALGGDVERLGVVVGGRVVVGGARREGQHGPDLEAVALELEVLGDRTRGDGDGAPEAHHLLDGGRGETGIGAELGPLLGMLGKHPHAQAELVAGGVVPGEEQGGDHRLDLVVGQTVIGLAGLQEGGHQVVARVGPPVAHETVDVGLHLPHAPLDVGAVGAQLEGQGPGDGPVPLGEVLVIDVRDAQQVAHDLDGIVLGDVGHEVATTLRDEGSDEPGQRRPHVGAVDVNGARGEGPAGELAHPNMVLAFQGEDRRAWSVVERAFADALHPHDVRDRAAQVAVGQKGLHLWAADDEPTQDGAGHPRLLAEPVDDRRRVGLEVLGEHVEERCIVDCLHTANDTPRRPPITIATTLTSPMFDSLTDRFDTIFTRLRGKGRLGEAEVDEVLREIRVALLEADVNLVVVRGLVGRIREACIGADLSKSLSPAQQVIKIVHTELIETLGGETLKITYASKPPTVVLLAGLQGSGKTAAAAKLARWFKQQGRSPLLVGADLQRPAAVEQLRVLGGQAGVPVFSEPTDPVAVARAGLAEAVRVGRDVLIVDTAGRLAIDEELMEEVRNISAAVEPHYTFLVIDAMIGQDAVTTAESFHRSLELDGVIMSKLDGDARGGAALSVKEVVGRPIVFASTGEKLADFEQFHADRMASRILGMGDVLTLIERAEQEYDQDVAAKAAEKLQDGRFTLEDFLEQMQQIKKMGPLSGLMKMMPGLPKELRNAEIDDRELARVEAIIRAMTPGERDDPTIINGSRRLRIATGSGTTTTAVNALVKQFQDAQKMFRAAGIGPRLNKSKAKARRKKGRR